MYKLRRTKQRDDASMKSSSDSSMNVDQSKPADLRRINPNYVISEKEREYISWRQSQLWQSEYEE